jgi:hypothetical protein
MLYVWAINLIPAALIASAWFFHYTRPVTLPKSRQILFGCGLASSNLGAILLIVFLMVNFADPSHCRTCKCVGRQTVDRRLLDAYCELFPHVHREGSPACACRVQQPNPYRPPLCRWVGNQHLVLMQSRRTYQIPCFQYSRIFGKFPQANGPEL